MSILERLSSHQTASGSGLLRHQQRPALPSVCGTALPRAHRRRVIRSNCSSSSELQTSSNASLPAEAATPQRTEDHTSDVKTRYIAETLLPTRHGKFRLRGYKHSVSMKFRGNRNAASGSFFEACCCHCSWWTNHNAFNAAA